MGSLALDLVRVQPMTNESSQIFNIRNEYMSVTANSQQMNFKTKDLITKLESNKEKHASEFNEAMKGYRETIGKMLKDAIKKFNSGENQYENGFNLVAQTPRSYEKEYTTIIEMLKMCTDEQITLDRSSFQNYVMDEWTWTSQFKASTALYSKS